MAWAKEIPIDDPDLLPPQKAAEEFGKSASRIYSLLADGTVPERMAGGRKLVSRTALDRYFQRERPAKSPKERRAGRTRCVNVSLTEDEMEKIKAISDAAGGGKNLTRGIRALLAIHVGGQQNEKP